MVSTPYETDVLVVGAGLIGSSVAMHLAKLGVTDVRVTDFDLDGTLSSSELNAGGVRGTWAQPINVLMSKWSIDFMAAIADEVGYRPCGYLWLKTAETLPSALKMRERQIELGWPVQAWDVAELRRRIPFIDKTEDLAGAVYGERDGLVNPNLLKMHFRARARELGAKFDDRTVVRAGERQADGSWLVECERFGRPASEDEKREHLSGRDAGLPSTRVKYRAKRVVNCAGAWAPEVAKALGYACPSKPVRQQISMFDCRDVDLSHHGMIIDTSGVYFHPEATNGLSGFCRHAEPEGVNFEYEGESFFMEQIWPALYERSTGFERLRHLTGWAGQYEVSPDESAIIGRAAGAGAAVGESGVYEAHSFSGHGAMHSPAAGLALAELMVKGRYETIDCSQLSGERFVTGKLVREGLVI